MLKRLLKLAQELDDAGLTKEADLADKIAQMDEFDDTAGWGAYDSMSEVDSAGEIDEISQDAEEMGFDDASEEPNGVEELVAQLDALKGLVEEGMVDEETLAEVQSQVDALTSLFLGGGPGLVTGDFGEGAEAFGGSMELGAGGIESARIPVAEAGKSMLDMVKESRKKNSLKRAQESETKYSWPGMVESMEEEFRAHVSGNGLVLKHLERKEPTGPVLWDLYFAKADLSGNPVDANSVERVIGSFVYPLRKAEEARLVQSNGELFIHLPVIWEDYQGVSADEQQRTEEAFDAGHYTSLPPQSPNDI